MTDAIRELIQAGRWISVDDAIPALGDYSVLARFPNGSEETIHVEDYFKDITNGLSESGEQLYSKWYKGQGISHWRSIPDDRLAEACQVLLSYVTSMAADGWEGAKEVIQRANEIATKKE